MSKIVVIGGGGFIGLNLVRRLSVKNKVLVVGRKPLQGSHRNVTFIQSNLEDINIKDTIRKEDVVYNLASPSVPYSSFLDPIKEIDYHIKVHVKMLKEIAETKVKKVFFASSAGGVYADKHNDDKFTENDAVEPVSPHAISKMTIEHFLRYFCNLHSVSYTIMRISNPYGSDQKSKSGFGIVPTFIQCIHKQVKPVIFNKGKTVRDFIYIDDLTEIMSMLLEKDNAHNLYNIGSGTGTSINDLWNIIKEVTGSTMVPVYKSKRSIDREYVVLDVSRIQSEFGWSARTDIKSGIKKCLK